MAAILLAVALGCSPCAPERHAVLPSDRSLRRLWLTLAASSNPEPGAKWLRPRA